MSLISLHRPACTSFVLLYGETTHRR